MTGQLTHKHAFELLPWYVNGTLDPDEHRDVRAHLSDCLVCRRELAFLERLEHEIAAAPDPDAALQRSLASVMRRIDVAEAPAAQRLWSAFVGAMRGTHPLVRVTLVAQAAALALVTILFVRAPGPNTAPDFVTLTDANALAAPAPGQVRLRVVFGPQMSVADMDSLLRAAGARVVDGPSSVGAYAIDAPTDASTTLLEELRADMRVSYAALAAAEDAQ